MAIVYETLKNRKFEEIVHTYTERDTMLYALSARVLVSTRWMKKR